MIRAGVIAGLATLGLAVTAIAPVCAEIPATTRKVVLERTETGRYRWKLIEALVPAVGDRQVLVRMRAVALNRGDLEMLAPDERRDHSGRVVASDGAGDVVAVGKRVEGIRPGQRVTSLYFQNWTDGLPSAEILAGAHGFNIDGVLGDYILLEETAVAPAPSGLSYEEAATLPTAGLTAWMASVGQRELHRGDIVLVQGTGGVSMFVLQFAAASRARVIVTSSSEEKLRRAKALGADDGINYRTTPAWAERVLELTDNHGADLVVDVGGKETLALSVASLAYAGTLSIVGGLTGYGGDIPSLGLLMKTARAQGVFVGSRADFMRMSAFIEKHRLHPAIDRKFPLVQFEEALQLMQAGNFVGKIVLQLP
jgi:NADPH:quinone reductase-like Zn-dependent oxidoreductase